MNKKDIGIGVISLVISAVLQAVLTSKLQKDWMMLVFLFLYAIVFLKSWHNSGIKNWLNDKCSKKALTVSGVIIMFAGIMLSPQSLGNTFSETGMLISNAVAFICWMLGLFLIQVSTENE